MVAVELRLGENTPAVAECLADWAEADAAKRLWAKDPTLWFADAVPELTDRLGWLDLPERLTAQVDELLALGEKLREEEVARVVLLGMGGSSLAPEVYQMTFGNAAGHPELTVLDSTHPDSVALLTETIDPVRTLFVVSSKSGTTLETLSLFRHFWSVVARSVDDPGRHFLAVTDPGSALAELAAERGFRDEFLAPQDVGGRYSALTEFGMVPAAAIGVDLERLAAGARKAATSTGPDVPVLANPGMQLGAALGVLARLGTDKASLLTSADLAALPSWIEQLIAESTGKSGTGIVPVVGEPVDSDTRWSRDRFFIGIETAGRSIDQRLHELRAAGHPVALVRLDNLEDLAGAMFVFEMAIAMAGKVLAIHPFDQPDVELAKELARSAMEGDLDAASTTAVVAPGSQLQTEVATWATAIMPGVYVGIQAFLPSTEKIRAGLDRCRASIREHRAVATTLDFGPRFLHSTGQLHKGGPPSGVFLQVIDEPGRDVPVPETDFDFARLISAQALGDYMALRERSRTVLRVSVGGDATGGLAALADALEAALG